MEVPLKFKFLVIAVLPLLAGCAGYRSCRLKRLTPQPIAHHENILFAAKAYSHADCHNYLDRSVIQAGYRPIQLVIINKSSKYLEFCNDKINLETVPVNMVAESVYQSVMARALGYGIPGLFIWPLLIPAVVDSLWAAEANEQLLRDYLGKSVHDKTISPNSELEGLIFVDNNNYQNKLLVTLFDRDTQEHIICKSYL
jgi:hypothetical protein